MANWRKVGLRRAAEIHAYVGENGSFKSYCAVRDTIPSLWQQRPVASTVCILDPDRMADSEAHALHEWCSKGLDGPPGRLQNPLSLPHPLWKPVRRWADLMDLEDRTDLLLDEVSGVVNSRAHQSLPPAVMNRIHQMRRADACIRWTTPAYQRADVSLREVTKAVTYCVGMAPEKQKNTCPMRCEADHEHRWPKLWGHNRLALWRTYNANDFDEFTNADVRRSNESNGQANTLRKLAREFHLRRKTSETMRYYDTMADVLTIEDVSEAGTCLDCGGNRRRPQCSCNPPARSEDRTAKPPARSPRASVPAASDAA